MISYDFDRYFVTIFDGRRAYYPKGFGKGYVLADISQEALLRERLKKYKHVSWATQLFSAIAVLGFFVVFKGQRDFDTVLYPFLGLMLALLSVRIPINLWKDKFTKDLELAPEISKVAFLSCRPEVTAEQWRAHVWWQLGGYAVTLIIFYAASGFKAPHLHSMIMFAVLFGVFSLRDIVQRGPNRKMAYYFGGSDIPSKNWVVLLVALALVAIFLAPVIIKELR